MTNLARGRILWSAFEAARSGVDCAGSGLTTTELARVPVAAGSIPAPPLPVHKKGLRTMNEETPHYNPADELVVLMERALAFVDDPARVIKEGFARSEEIIPAPPVPSIHEEGTVS